MSTTRGLRPSQETWANTFTSKKNRWNSQLASSLSGDLYRLLDIQKLFNFFLRWRGGEFTLQHLFVFEKRLLEVKQNLCQLPRMGTEGGEDRDCILAFHRVLPPFSTWTWSFLGGACLCWHSVISQMTSQWWLISFCQRNSNLKQLVVVVGSWIFKESLKILNKILKCNSKNEHILTHNPSINWAIISDFHLICQQFQNFSSLICLWAAFRSSKLNFSDDRPPPILNQSNLTCCGSRNLGCIPEWLLLRVQ